MTSLTINLPNEKYVRLEQIAKHRNLTLNFLMEEISTRVLVEFDAHTRFLSRAAQGKVKEGLSALDKLDAHFSRQSPAS
ncbi:CopG family transcriptional regulator [Candidatus Thiomargarita nelsonii]|uniref:CopG family transcriptional regulator n=1 Tax=Candidatus Thiomargarita nelsonii TaxID=1003181 RepID=A0A4E0QSX5_9GAMM|nr:CopG family transcriptional regulator [Candidatus Thiomargarita nelsonii]